MDIQEIYNKAKNNGFINLSEDEKKAMTPRLLKLVVKDEGVAGPVYITCRDIEYDDFMAREVNISFAYAPRCHRDDGTALAQWYNFKNAEKIANDLGIKFEIG